MTDTNSPNILSAAFLDVISDASIDEFASVGGVTLREWARQVLQDLARLYVYDRRVRSPTKTEARKFAASNKETLKRQKKRHKEIIEKITPLVELLEEEHREGPLVTSLALKLHRDEEARKIRLKNTMSIPQLVTQLRQLAEIAGSTSTVIALVTRNAETPRGRRPDGLNELITGVACVYVVVGGEITYTTDIETERPQIGPFYKAMKVFIDALPSDCPQPTLSAIVERVHKCQLVNGLTKGRAGRKKRKPSAFREVISTRIATRRLLDQLPRGIIRQK